jgi:hypothetical protein
VEDNDDKEVEAAVEAERDAQLCVAKVRVKAAAKAERVAATEADRIAEAEATEREAAVERAAHWAAEMDKAFAYQRDVDRRDVHRWEAVCHAETEHHLQRHRTMRHLEATILPTMAAIEAAGAAGYGDGGALQ